MLLCDEPLLCLDLRHQRRVAELVDRRRREHGTAVLFVTHEINPVLAVADTILYLTDQLPDRDARRSAAQRRAERGLPVPGGGRAAPGQVIVLGTDAPAHVHSHERASR